MAVKTQFSPIEIERLVTDYEIGEIRIVTPITTGKVQTNVVVETTRGKYVLRYYENRTHDFVRFETNVLNYLHQRGYACCAPLRTVHGSYISTYHHKPFVLFPFVEGIHVKQPSRMQRREIVRKMAELHLLTQRYRPAYTETRDNFNLSFSLRYMAQKARRLKTLTGYAKLHWAKEIAQSLSLPKPLPKGVCHCDWGPSNLLFRGNRLAAVLDFDNANYTYLLCDVVNVMDYWAWPHGGKLNLKIARELVDEYQRYRSLTATERRHLYDVYHLSILVDCGWFFERRDTVDFYEKRKIAALEALGREAFYQAMFE